MSERSALGVGRAIAAAEVVTLEEGFHEEHLELQPAEIAMGVGARESEGVDEDEM